MQTRSPFSFLDGAGAAPWQPPAWVVDETQQRLLLLLNHVLMQEPEAMRRLRQVQGKTLVLRWGRFTIGLVVTAAGLFDRFGAVADDSMPSLAQPDLALTLAERSPWALARSALRGEKPPLRIEGDAQLAAEINWLVAHVRWDIEEDLAQILGDPAARALGMIAQRLLRALREFAPAPAASVDAASDVTRAAGEVEKGQDAERAGPR